MARQDWRVTLAALDALDSMKDVLARRRRGHAFERVLHSTFEEASMEPRSRFRPTGEEIDGSFMHRGRPMLFKAKWTNDRIPASALYAFRGKIDGKLAGTLGVFISMGGFSPDAVDALIAGKAVNLILFDGNDIRKISQSDGMNIDAAIDFKLRAAAEEGTPLIPLPEPPAIAEKKPAGPLIIVEGPRDVILLQALSNAQNGPAQVTFMPAGGRLNQPIVALAQVGRIPSVSKLAIVADGDGRGKEVRHQIETNLADAGWPQDVELQVIVVEPDLETALGLTESRRPVSLETVIKRTDVDAQAAHDPDLRRLLETLGITTTAHE